MMKYVWAICALGAAMACGATPATADDSQTVAKTDDGTITLSATNGSNKRIALKIGTNALHTALTIDRLGYDPYHTPEFSITLTGGARKAVIKIASGDFRPPLSLRLELWIGDSFLQQVPYQRSLDLKEKLNVAIRWTDAGTVTVQLGDESQTIQMGGQITQVELSAAVGEATFSPLETSATGPKSFDFGYHLK